MSAFSISLMAPDDRTGEISDPTEARIHIEKLEKLRYHLGKRDHVWIRGIQETGLGWEAYITIRKFGQILVEERRSYTHEQLLHTFEIYRPWKATQK